MADAGDDLDKVVERFGEVQARYQELGGYEIEARAHEILAGLGLSQDQIAGDVGKLSGGWKMRVALARILLLAPDALLLDEPTNYLDLESILWLEQLLRDYAGAVIMTCHDRDVMNRVVAKIVEIDGGQVRSYTGDYDFYEAARAVEAEQREAEYRAAAVDAGQGDALRRALPRAGGQGVAGAERASRSSTRSSASKPPRRLVEQPLRVPQAAALGRRRHQGRAPVQALRRAQSARRSRAC